MTTTDVAQPGFERARLITLLEAERRRFVAEHPRSAELFERASRLLLTGVPMNWMRKWASPFPIFVDSARGAEVVDVDGNRYADFCLGDTGAMTGHGPSAVRESIERQLGHGITHMLPTEAAIDVATELQSRFGMEAWQFTVSATDANRFAIKLARRVTGRAKILVFNRCYHGTVDETFAMLDEFGEVIPRSASLGPPVPPALTTKVVEFNDVDALERALAASDVACVLAEPALTNVGIVLPEAGFHERLRELTRLHGTLLILDETHTLSAGPGGMTRAEGLEPDILVLGKAIGSGVPAGAVGLAPELARGIEEGPAGVAELEEGIGTGGTLAGNALSIAAMSITLQRVLTADNFEHMIALAQRWQQGVEEVVERLGLPWHVTRLGARAEYHFTPRRPRAGSDLAAIGDVELEDYLHLGALNRGLLMTPFHNMALMSPETTPAQVDLHTQVFAELAGDLVRTNP
jgi:glutamate-1-semialdehyde 2,1-aminomutase